MNQTILNTSSSFEANNETLDQVFKEQLLALREEIPQIPNTMDIELCYKWVNVFAKCTESEKLARNSLFLLMQKQIQEFQSLDYPFTDLSNCNRNLELLLKELDDQSLPITYESHTEHLNVSYTREKLQIISSSLSVSYEEQKVRTENKKLMNELEEMRTKVEKLEAHNKELQEDQLRMKVEISENIKKCQKMYTRLINKFHEAITTNDLKNKYIFSNIFVPFLEKNHINDTCLIQKLCECDNIFENILQQKAEYNKKLNKTFDKIKRKYNRRLHTYNWTLFLQIKLLQLRLHSKIHYTCLELKQCNDPIFILQKLEEMEFNCETIFNEIL